MIRLRPIRFFFLIVVLISSEGCVLRGRLEPQKTIQRTGPVAVMYPCRACHSNYEFEEFTIIHTIAGYRCENCHDVFESHRLYDEQDSTKKIVNSRETTQILCLNCHPKETINTEQHEKYFSGILSTQDCFDCHGNHRFK